MRRVTVNVPDEVGSILDELVKDRGTVTNVVRDAIATEWYLSREMDSGKRLVLVDDKTRHVKELVFRVRLPRQGTEGDTENPPSGNSEQPGAWEPLPAI